MLNVLHRDCPAHFTTVIVNYGQQRRMWKSSGKYICQSEILRGWFTKSIHFCILPTKKREGFSNLLRAENKNGKKNIKYPLTLTLIFLVSPRWSSTLHVRVSHFWGPWACSLFFLVRCWQQWLIDIIPIKSYLPWKLAFHGEAFRVNNIFGQGLVTKV